MRILVSCRQEHKQYWGKTYWLSTSGRRTEHHLHPALSAHHSQSPGYPPSHHNKGIYMYGARLAPASLKPCKQHCSTLADPSTAHHPAHAATFAAPQATPGKTAHRVCTKMMMLQAVAHNSHLPPAPSCIAATAHPSASGAGCVLLPLGSSPACLTFSRKALTALAPTRLASSSGVLPHLQGCQGGKNS